MMKVVIFSVHQRKEKKSMSTNILERATIEIKKRDNKKKRKQRRNRPMPHLSSFTDMSSIALLAAPSAKQAPTSVLLLSPMPTTFPLTRVVHYATTLNTPLNDPEDF